MTWDGSLKNIHTTCYGWPPINYARLKNTYKTCDIVYGCLQITLQVLDIEHMPGSVVLIVQQLLG